MNNINLAIISGNLTKDAEIKTYKKNDGSQEKYAKFDIACNQGNATSFVPCVAYGSTAEYIAKYYHRGDELCISGRISYQSYTDKNNVKRMALTLMVDRTYSTFGLKANRNVAQSPVPGKDGEFLEVEQTSLPF